MFPSQLFLADGSARLAIYLPGPYLGKALVDIRQHYGHSCSVLKGW